MTKMRKKGKIIATSEKFISTIDDRVLEGANLTKSPTRNPSLGHEVGSGGCNGAREETGTVEVVVVGSIEVVVEREVLLLLLLLFFAFKYWTNPSSTTDKISGATSIIG